MVIQEIYDWLESRTGSPYDFRDEISELDIADAFLAPVDWYNTITITLDRLEDCVEDINEHKDEIPDYLPSAQDIKKLIIEETCMLFMDKLNEVKQRIGIKETTINDVDDLTRQCYIISQVINLCKETKIGQIIVALRKFEEENEDYLLDNFDISERDYSQLYSDITDVVADFEENE
jgi:hypothetical protein